MALLAACTAAPDTQDGIAEAAPSGSSSQELTEQEPVTDGAGAAEPQAAPEASASLPAVPEPIPVDDDPDKLIGLSGPALSQRLGEPELVRREAPAEIWQYRTSDCVFDLFLYEKNGQRQVTYLEARDTQAQIVPVRPCLNQLLRAQSDTAAGTG